MNQAGWLSLLFREEAAVTVAVNEGKYVFLYRALQSPEKPISTAEYVRSGKRTQNAFFSTVQVPDLPY